MKAPAVKKTIKASPEPELAIATKVVLPVKATAKAAPKPVAKAQADTPVAAKTQAPVKTAKALSSPPPKKPDQVTTKTQATKTQATPVVEPAKAIKPVIAAKPAPSEPQLSALGIPVRTGRPSSRLVQLTVPSMAQSVASTAAKASFTQVVQLQPIVPPLASSVKKDSKLANNWKTKPVAELTDDEVIAMSDSEYMNAAQLAFFRLKLVTLKNDILNNAGETTEHLREDTVVVPDPADRATIEEEHALELRTRDRERKLLKKIEQSIDLIDSGDYGYCDETGEAIGVGRLLARPTATLSLEAQQRRELKQKMFGD